MADIRLVPLERDDSERFILDNQEAFNYGALEEFGVRDDCFEEDGQIISRETIEKYIDGGIAYRIMDGDKKSGRSRDQDRRESRRNTQERISEMYERAREIRRKRYRLRTVAAGTVSGLLTVCLVFVLHRIENLNHAILNEDNMGSSLLSDSAGGYVLIAYWHLRSE